MTTLPPIYCLTLPETPWKEDAARAHFSSLRLPACFVHGFHGMTLGLRPTAPYEYSSDGSPSYIHVSTIGCALSHLALLTVAVTEGAPSFIACEDDVFFRDDFTARWSNIQRELPPSIDVLQLSYILPETAPGTTAPLTALAPGLATVPHYAYCATAIWWTRAAAITALRSLRPVNAAYDIMLMRQVYPFLNHALTNPQLATQRTTFGNWPSSIKETPHSVDP